MRPPVQILKFLAIDVQLFTLKFYNNITKTGSEFIIKRLQCALPQLHSKGVFPELPKLNNFQNTNLKMCILISELS